VIKTLETERLVMRPFRTDDLAALTVLQADPSFWWYPLRRGMEPDESARFMERRLAEYDRPDRPSFHAVIERASGALIGWAGLSVPDFLPEVLPAIEVGWRLGSAHRGRGYATEAAAAALDWGFGDLGLASVVSIFEPDNAPSGRVMDRLGFDPGFDTLHPVRDVPVRVRSLTAERWQDQRPADRPDR
jgi:RimJ/RimL family protein N-acetyltransferase